MKCPAKWLPFTEAISRFDTGSCAPTIQFIACAREKAIDPTSKHWPMEIFIPNGSSNGDMAIDVTVRAFPGKNHHVQRLDFSKAEKRSHYEDICIGKSCQFQPMVLTT
jgi:hypothetical protein